MRAALLLALLFSSHVRSTAPLQSVNVSITFEGKPLARLHLEYYGCGEERTIGATSDENGVAVLRLKRGTLPCLKKGYQFPWAFKTDEHDAYSADFVLDEPSVHGTKILLVARHTATWQMRTRPRVCDELARVRDIPSGSLWSMSADEYNRWYSNLSDHELANCQVLTKLQNEIGTLAPWYYYAYLEQEHTCDDGRPGEIDWATWYRRLLEKATGATPGKECESDWERWWKGKGYGPVPRPPASSEVKWQ